MKKLLRLRHFQLIWRIKANDSKSIFVALSTNDGRVLPRGSDDVNKLNQISDEPFRVYLFLSSSDWRVRSITMNEGKTNVLECFCLVDSKVF